jgi:hypothetical protein
MAQANSFLGTNENVGNTACRSLIADVMELRTQITRTNEIRAIGGWGDPLNNFIGERLDAIRETMALQVRDLRSAPNQGESSVASSDGQSEREDIVENEARDESMRLRESFDMNKPVTADDIQMPPGNQFRLPYDFTGLDPNFPQVHVDPEFQNVWLCNFIIAIDEVVVHTSTLACSSFGHTIPADQAGVILVGLESCFAILQTKGGETNRQKVIAPTDPRSLTGKVGPEVEHAVVSDPVSGATAGLS